jgi:hypothetical protein
MGYPIFFVEFKATKLTKETQGPFRRKVFPFGALPFSLCPWWFLVSFVANQPPKAVVKYNVL